ELQRNPHRLPVAAKPGAERVEIEPISGARERGAEATVRRLENIADAGEPGLCQQRAIEPALRRAAGMHALDHGAVLRGHQAGGLCSCDAKRMHGLLRVKLEAARGTGGSREHAKGRARVPALADMLLAHAAPDTRTDLIAGDRRREKIAPAHWRMTFGDCDQRRQHDRAAMEHAVAVHVVELEALHLRAVDQRRIGRGQRLRSAPDRGRARSVQIAERLLQNATPFELGAIDRTAERVEDQELSPLAYALEDLLVA